jgi:hypothetical protein
VRRRAIVIDLDGGGLWGVRREFPEAISGRYGARRLLPRSVGDL